MSVLCILYADTASSEDIEDIKSVLLDPSVIRIATSNFSEENKLGEGGFGQVYKVNPATNPGLVVYSVLLFSPYFLS